mmetsp:Transcript_60237/g.111684  ORF Transcript_60237/g.111684 Transcript_60237/m.111684 type:complete len:155 (-) Transcript_60237:120-584(-)
MLVLVVLAQAVLAQTDCREPKVPLEAMAPRIVSLHCDRNGKRAPLLGMLVLVVLASMLGPAFISKAMPAQMQREPALLPAIGGAVGATIAPQVTWAAVDGFEGFNKMQMAVKEEPVKTGSASDGPLAFGLVGISAVLFVLVVIVAGASKAQEDK